MKKIASVTPFLITTESQELMDKSVYGGKASSLYRLKAAGYAVPEAWVIPCEYCISRPEIKLDNITASYGPRAQFAVRSGAPVSMPGLLNTKLNVSTVKLQPAITAVWDSWDTEHAKLYRNAKGLDDGMGTAVIIQKQIKAIKAGVGFTSNPNSDPSKAVYDPLVEYVEGLGDALVSGEKTPIKVDNDYPGDLAHLYYYLKKIHAAFGPSDVEWCLDKYGSLWFVQQRALRFAEHAEHVDTSDKKLIMSGKAIGAPVQVTAVIKMAKKAINEGEAIYVNEFKPEYYPLMVKAAAIICASGGETCHASIIARELNKPAISGISVSQISIDGQPVFIDGSNGSIYETAGVVVSKKKGKKVVAFKPVLSEARVPQFDLIPGQPSKYNRYHANHLLARFYYNIDQFHKGLISQSRKDAIVKEIADVLCIYLYNATLGELRHLRVHASAGVTRDALALKVEQTLGWTLNTHSSKTAREEWVLGIKKPESIQKAVDITALTLACYTKIKWSSSFGGPAWGRIVDVLHRYLTGEYTPTLFVDTAFNLQHNGGCVFGKFEWFTAYGSYLGYQLQAKFTGDMEKVLEYARGGTDSVQVDIHDYINKESILLTNPASKQVAA